MGERERGRRALSLLLLEFRAWCLSASVWSLAEESMRWRAVDKRSLRHVCLSFLDLTKDLKESGSRIVLINGACERGDEEQLCRRRTRDYL